MTGLIDLLIFLAAVGSGLMSGLFFVFSNFAMKALEKLPPNYGSAAMRSINVTIINPWFLTVFVGTAVCGLLSTVLAILNWGEPRMLWILCGSGLYIAGCMGVTFAFNVPLNNKLAASDPESQEGIVEWQVYLARWTPWNHVRTVATLAATIGFLGALSL